MVVDLDMDRPRAGHETSQHGAFSIVYLLLPLPFGFSHFSSCLFLYIPFDDLIYIY